MKRFIATVLCLSAFSAFGADLTSTITNIEYKHNAKCIKAGGSWFNLCSGSIPRLGDSSVPYTCTYSVKYKCMSNSGDFKLKLRVKESYNRRTLERETKVLKVTYK